MKDSKKPLKVCQSKESSKGSPLANSPTSSLSSRYQFRRVLLFIGCYSADGKRDYLRRGSVLV